MSIKHYSAKNSLVTHVQTFFQELKTTDRIWKQSMVLWYRSKSLHDMNRPQIHWVGLFFACSILIIVNFHAAFICIHDYLADPVEEENWDLGLFDMTCDVDGCTAVFTSLSPNRSLSNAREHYLNVSSPFFLSFFLIIIYST